MRAVMTVTWMVAMAVHQIASKKPVEMAAWSLVKPAMTATGSLEITAPMPVSKPAAGMVYFSKAWKLAMMVTPMPVMDAIHNVDEKAAAMVVLILARSATMATERPGMNVPMPVNPPAVAMAFWHWLVRPVMTRTMIKATVV